MSVEIVCDKAFEEGDRLNVFFIGDGLPLTLSGYLQLIPSVALYRSLEREPNCFLASSTSSVRAGAASPEPNGHGVSCVFGSFDGAAAEPPAVDGRRPLNRLPENMIVHVYGPAFRTPRHQADALVLAEQMIDRHAREHRAGTRMLFLSGVSDVSALRERPRLMETSSYIGVTDDALLAELNGSAARYSGPESAGALGRFTRRSESNRPVVIGDLDMHAPASETIAKRIITASAAALAHHEGRAQCEMLVGERADAAVSTALDAFCADSERRWSLSIRRRDLLQDLLSGGAAVERSLLVTSCPHMALLGLYLECPTLLIATPETLPRIPAELIHADRDRLRISVADDLEALRALVEFNGRAAGENPVLRMLAAQTDKSLAVASAYFQARAALERSTLEQCCAAFAAASRDLAELRSRIAMNDRLLKRADTIEYVDRSFRRFTRTNYWRQRSRKISKSIRKRLSKRLGQ